VNILRPKKIVLLGMMSRMAVAGNVWLVAQYLIGFQRLGYEVYYVEAHGCAPLKFIRGEGDDGWAGAARFIAGIMESFGLRDRWALHAVYDHGDCYGLSATQLKELYRSAALIINLHGGTIPLPEHAATGRLVYLGTDPGEREIDLDQNVTKTVDLLAPHCAFFTWGLNYGHPDCGLPVSERFHFRPSPPPVVMDFWEGIGDGRGRAFTTVGNWRQAGREVRYRGEVYHWSKHLEFLKFLDVPRRTGQVFELALSGSSYTPAERQLLEASGWAVRDALTFSANPDAYRRYVAGSRGEFTVAKDQNVRLRSGWFSERSATYLAAGRPVVTQETGFGNVLPTGEGLFAFATLDDIVAAVECLNADYERHAREARQLAREYFNYDVVLPRLLSEAGV